MRRLLIAWIMLALASVACSLDGPSMDPEGTQCRPDWNLTVMTDGRFTCTQ